MIDISVAVPVYNEEELIHELIKRLSTVLGALGSTYEIIFIDDGSRDATPKIIAEYASKDPHIKLLSFSRNFGHQAAVSAALDYVQGERVIVMDGDLQDPPEILPALIAKHTEGYDVVYAIRRKRKEGILKRAAYHIYYRLLALFSSDVKMPHDAGDFSILSKNVVAQIKNLPERNRYVRGLRAWVGFKQTGFEYERDQRFAGETKYSLRKLFKLAYDGFFLHSNAPLFLVNFFGFLFAIVAFIGIITVLILRFAVESYVPGFASTAILILFVGGVQMLSFGVLGEYIRRIYDEVKGRPVYIVREKINFKD